MKHDGSFDIDDAREAVRRDTEGVLGSFLDGRFTLDDIGDAAWRAGGSELFAVRWHFKGRHVGP